MEGLRVQILAIAQAQLLPLIRAGRGKSAGSLHTERKEPEFADGKCCQIHQVNLVQSTVMKLITETEQQSS
jgi:hypothetical protein